MSDIRDEIASAAIAWDAVRRQAAAHKAERTRRAMAMHAAAHYPCRHAYPPTLCTDCEALERSHANYRAAAVQSGVWLRRLRRLIRRAQDH